MSNEINQSNETPKYKICEWVYKNTTRHHNPGDICNKKIDLTKELCGEHTRISKRPNSRKENKFIFPTKLELLT